MQQYYTKDYQKTSTETKQKNIYLVSPDYTLYISVIFLILIGILMVFSASYYVAVRELNLSPFHYLIQQSTAAVIGFFVMFITANVHYRYTKRFIGIFYWFAMALLILVLIMGAERGGVARWLTVPGTSFTFQPSEIAKLAAILMVSNKISTINNVLLRLRGTLYVGFFAALPTFLIIRNNFSSGLIMAAVGFGILFVASPHTAAFVLLGISGVAAIVLFLMFGGDFRGARFDVWLDPFSDPLGIGYQTIQSLYAIGSGGLFGLGLGGSRQKLGFIPEAHNDIIFSVIIEELGLVGGVLVLFLFGVFLWRAFKIAVRSGDMFGSLIATGIAIMIGSHVVINIGVVTNSIPNTGVPLPFISYGGTALVTAMASTGLLLSISRFTKSLN